MGRKLRTRTITVKPRQINYVKIADRLPFAFWVASGKMHVSLIDNVDYEVNVMGQGEEVKD